MGKRVFVIVLDSFGVGALPDAAEFGDAGANTLGSIAVSALYSTPEMERMGLFNIDGVDCRKGVESPIGSFGRMAEQSRGKDTTIGHWELAGIISHKPMPTYPDGFPAEVIDEFKRLTGREVLCNKPYSGTKALEDFGEEHMRTGALIVYTSADSVFQVAAHEEKVPIPELYDICQKARDMLKGEHAVGRVIARPFLGSSPADFKRTTNRHDFSLKPTAPTMLDCIAKAGMATIGVGKIYDIFAGMSVSEQFKNKSNHHGMETTIELADRDFTGLCFVNLVDFDMVYGHRRNIDGYAEAATDFDRQLRELMGKMGPEDVIMITADHGCDPGYTKTTDHTREYVPILVWGQSVKQGVNLGTLPTFADMAATVLDYLGVEQGCEGESFWGRIKK